MLRLRGGGVVCDLRGTNLRLSQSLRRSCLRRAALPFSSGTSMFISSGETRRMADMAGDHYNKTTLLQLQTLQRKAKGVAARRECLLIRFVRECVS